MATVKLREMFMHMRMLSAHRPISIVVTAFYTNRSHTACSLLHVLTHLPRYLLNITYHAIYLIVLTLVTSPKSHYSLVALQRTPFTKYPPL